jgi:phosphoglucosamine mutase
MESDKVRRSVREAEVEMGNEGRVLLRPSGTEPLIRVMVEGSDGAKVDDLSGQIATAVKELVS